MDFFTFNLFSHFFVNSDCRSRVRFHDNVLNVISINNYVYFTESVITTERYNIVYDYYIETCHPAPAPYRAGGCAGACSTPEDSNEHRKDRRNRTVYGKIL